MARTIFYELHFPPNPVNDAARVVSRKIRPYQVYNSRISIIWILNRSNARYSTVRLSGITVRLSEHLLSGNIIRLLEV